MHKRGYCRHAVSVRPSVRPFVRPSVCLSHFWIMSKQINISSNFFHFRGSHTILVFPYQTGWRYSDGNPPNGGVECRWGIDRNRNSGLISFTFIYTCIFFSWQINSAAAVLIAYSWLSKIVGRAKCQKHLQTTKLSIWHSRPRTTGYRSIAGRANYEVTKTVTDDHSV